MGLTKFGELQGSMDFSGDGKRYKKRVDLARKCLEHIAGSPEDAALMAKHLAGFANRTTDSILEKFNTLPPKTCATADVQNLYVGEIANKIGPKGREGNRFFLFCGGGKGAERSLATRNVTPP